jgi:phosphatidylinositol 4-kinase
MSTPNFINDLTDISVRILKSENKEKFLSDNLQKMNKSLPATTYMPILSSTFQRNFMVLNIAYPESRLFITAEKAPFLICIEVF